MKISVFKQANHAAIIYRIGKHFGFVVISLNPHFTTREAAEKAARTELHHRAGGEV